MDCSERDADEADIAGGLRAAGVVHGVADVRRSAGPDELRDDVEQAFGSRLGFVTSSSATIMDQVRSGTKRFSVSSASYCRRPVKMQSAMSLARAGRAAPVGDPLLAQDQAVVVVAEEDAIEMIDHVSYGTSMPESARILLRERPVVVPAALVLVVLDAFVRDVGPVKCSTVSRMVSR